MDYELQLLPRPQAIPHVVAVRAAAFAGRAATHAVVAPALAAALLAHDPHTPPTPPNPPTPTPPRCTASSGAQMFAVGYVSEEGHRQIWHDHGVSGSTPSSGGSAPGGGGAQPAAAVTRGQP